MSEVVSDLILMDLILKDRDGNFVVCFSGYVSIRQLRPEEKLRYDSSLDFLQEEKLAKVIEASVPDAYAFSILIVQETKRAKLHHVELTLENAIIRTF